MTPETKNILELFFTVLITYLGGRISGWLAKKKRSTREGKAIAEIIKETIEITMTNTEHQKSRYQGKLPNDVARMLFNDSKAIIKRECRRKGFWPPSDEFLERSIEGELEVQKRKDKNEPLN